MSRSLALGAYLALSALGGGRAVAEPPRPEGPLAWMHAAGPDRLAALTSIADRLAGDGATSLVTLARMPEPSTAPPQGLLLRPVPTEGAAAAAFLDHWRPDLLLWVGGDLRPGLLARLDAPRLLVEGAPEPRLLAPGIAMPGLARAVVPLFDRALVTGDVAAERLARAGLSEERIEMAGPLQTPSPVLPCNERERRDLAQTIGARPVWLAADLPLAELPAVVAAHRIASRSAHRLLLILAPAQAEEAPAMAKALGVAGLRVAQRADGEEPEDGTQVYLADGTAEMGLWLRLAPLAYLGGTLQGRQGGGRNPFDAAALGCATLHGPATAAQAAAWGLLDVGGASRLVRNGAELGRAVEALLSPERVAEMAHAGWDAATKGAEVTNRVVDLIRERLFPASDPAIEPGPPALAGP